MSRSTLDARGRKPNSRVERLCNPEITEQRIFHVLFYYELIRQKGIINSIMIKLSGVFFFHFVWVCVGVCVCVIFLS